MSLVLLKFFHLSKLQDGSLNMLTCSRDHLCAKSVLDTDRPKRGPHRDVFFHGCRRGTERMAEPQERSSAPDEARCLPLGAPGSSPSWPYRRHFAGTALHMDRRESSGALAHIWRSVTARTRCKMERETGSPQNSGDVTKHCTRKKAAPPPDKKRDVKEVSGSVQSRHGGESRRIPPQSSS